jgi:ribonuclease HII
MRLRSIKLWGILLYEREIKNLLKKQVNITGRNKADEKYKIVSLASIIAKASREKHITEKRQKYGRDIGSGYPGDRKTRKFLERYYSKNGKLPEETRLKWSTSQEIIDEFAQSSINDF